MIKKIIWVLTDDRVGSNNQSIALAEKLSNNFIVKNIKYNFLIKIPNIIRQSTLIGVNKKKSDDINNNFPDIIISAGRRLSSVALNIKKKSNKKIFLINILNPNLNFKKFDLVILPKHDNFNIKKYNNIIEINGSLTKINKELLKNDIKKWTPFFSKYKKPFISFLIGGDTKNYKFDNEKFENIIKHISKLINNINGTLLLNTSRRTNNECLSILKKYVTCDNYFYNWNEKLGNDSPYFSFLDLSDYIIVTADSMSMISDACSTGKPVYVYIPTNKISKKHLNFVNIMKKENYIKLFNENLIEFEKYFYTPLNEVERIANIVKDRIKNDI